MMIEFHLNNIRTSSVFPGTGFKQVEIPAIINPKIGMRLVANFKFKIWQFFELAVSEKLKFERS